MKKNKLYKIALKSYKEKHKAKEEECEELSLTLHRYRQALSKAGFKLNNNWELEELSPQSKAMRSLKNQVEDMLICGSQPESITAVSEDDTLQNENVVSKE